jgi:maltose/moltooligosaccharide transporter
MKTRPRLSFWQIWNMSFGFLGIQFGFALQNANVSRIFETLDAPISSIPILWIAAPITGLIIQPIIGYMSDKTWNRLGRRRPFFLVGAILASVALIIMPNSPMLWVAAGMLWIMDASINISMEPFRAFVGDMLPAEQRTKGFAMQSFFIGTGAVIASALPYILTNWLNVPNTAPEGVIPLSVKYSFYIGAGAFFLSVLWTIVRTREYSPDQLKEYDMAERPEYYASLDKKPSDEILPAARFLRRSYLWTGIGILLTSLLYYGRLYGKELNFELEAELYVFTGAITFYGIIQLITGLLVRLGKTRNGMVAIINDLYSMPPTMKQLAVVQFFSWFALFSMWIYTTAGITSEKYDMKISQDDFMKIEIEYDRLQQNTDPVLMKDFPWEVFGSEMEKLEKKFSKGIEEVAVTMRLLNMFLKDGAATTEGETKQYFNKFEIDQALFDRFVVINKSYNTGADWVGIMFAAYNGFAALVAFALVFLAKITSRKTTHMISLIFGGLGLISVYFFNDPNLFIVSMVGVGLAWASILSMPYAILSGSLPAQKMGVYMGIFNFFIVLPQILAASILGIIIKDLFYGEPIYAMIVGGVSLFIAAFFVIFVHDKDTPVKG